MYIVYYFVYGRRADGKVKRKDKKKKSSPEKAVVIKKSIYDVLGVGPDVINDEVKIVIVGNNFIEFHNHNGIVDITDECIKINAKKSIYNVNGKFLKICFMSNDEVDIRGIIASIVSE